jgi:hypothetical protein
MLLSYALYLASFKTSTYKTKREYIGITLQAADRKRALRENAYKQPWLAAGTEDLDMRSVLEHIPGKQAALAMEALCAAQRMVDRRMGVCRGGPWVLRTLSLQDEQEVREVSRCNSLPDVFALADKYPNGHLAFHLGDLKYKAETGRSIATRAVCSMKAMPRKTQPMKAAPMKALTMQQLRASPVKLSGPVLRGCKRDVLKISKARTSGVRKPGCKPKESGAARRSRLGLAGKEFLKDKYGDAVNETRNAHLRKWREQQKHHNIIVAAVLLLYRRAPVNATSLFSLGEP